MKADINNALFNRALLDTVSQQGRGALAHSHPIDANGGDGRPIAGGKKVSEKITLAQFKNVCVNRMMIGGDIGPFCVTSLTGFFLTWFPTYLYCRAFRSYYAELR